MARIASLAHITLTSYAACLVLVACGEGTGDDPGTPSGSGAGGSGGSIATGGSAPGGGSATAGTGTSAAGSAGSSSASGSPSGGSSSSGGSAGGGNSSGGSTTGGQAGGGSGGTSGASPGGSSATAGTGGTSTAPSCEDDEDACGGKCVNLDEDPQNCGSCGKKCSSGQTCEDGACAGGGTTPVNGTCSSITDFGTVSATIVVKNGETYDGKCRRYRADPDTLGDGSQAEDQKPVFIVEDGGKLINVVLGAPAADGIHTKGDVTLENITWEDIGEDAMTIKESGTVVLNGGSAKNGDDKVFQINAASTFRVSNFKAQKAGKFIRQNGDTTFKVQVFIDKCDISDMDEAIFRTDSSSSTVSLTNTRYSNIGDSLFIGVSSGNITQSGNTEY